MVGTEVNRSLHVHNREAAERTSLESLLDALFDRRDVFRRNHAALDLVDELEALAGFLRFELEAHMSVLTATTGLLDVLVLVLDRSRDRLAVSNLRSAHVASDVEFAFQTVNDNFEVKLTHTGDDRLARLLIVGNDEGRVFHRESVESGTELFVVLTGLGLHRNRDNRSREVDGLESDRMLGIAERVTRAGLRETDASHDVASLSLVKSLLLVGVHAEETGDALLLIDRGVEQFAAELERTRVDTHERDLAHGLVGHDLERKTAERLVVVGFALLGRIVSGNSSSRIDRGRKVVANSVEERLNALILERRTAECRRNRASNAALADGNLDFSLSELLASEELLHESVILLSGGLDHLLAVFLSLFHVLGRNFLFDNRLSEVLHIEAEGLHLDEVDDAIEGFSCADRNHHRNGVRAELILHLLHHIVEVGADAVHLVDERNLRHFVLLRLTPHLLGLGLNAADRAVEGDSAVENAERTLHLGREVHVSGSVNEREAVVAPGDARSGGLNRDAALLLLDHEVHRRSAIVHFADLVVLARIVEDTLGRGRLTTVDMRHDAEIAHMVKRESLCHLCFS